MNTKMWNFYKDSEKGKSAINAFEPEVNDARIEKLAEYEQSFGGAYSADDMFYYYFQIQANFEAVEEFGELSDTRESFAKFVDIFDIEEAEFTDTETKFTGRLLFSKDNFRAKACLVEMLSVFLYYNYKFYKPVLFSSHFSVIQQNCDAIGLELPPIPRTNDYRAYMMYYYDICEAFNKFQEQYGLSDAEFCACLYDFAPMQVDDTVAEVELPKPINVWLTGAAPGDFEILDGLGKGDNSGNPNLIWACNERTRRGDIVIIYCRTPRSYIHSVWRSKTGGFFNPFDYYHCRTNVCDGIRVPEITSKDLKADSYFANVPIVRKNLQGINGVELTAQDYSELLRFIEQKGGDTSALPKLFESGKVDFGELKLEKDVEEKILIPFLQKIGYSETDWTRQLSLKAGRNEKAIPDFAFFPQGDRHFESAPMLIEAKYDMSLITEQQKAFSQALSYARMLRSSIMGICDKERLVLYKVDKNGASDRSKPIYENHWETIYSDAVEGAKLKQLIGRDVVKDLH